MEEEVEIIEVGMNDEDIEETIAQLMELKESKGSAQISIADDLDLVVNYLDVKDDGLVEGEEGNAG